MDVRKRVARALGTAMLGGAFSLGALGTATEAQERGPEIRTVDVDGHSVRVRISGLDRRRAQEPVVVLEAGATNGLDDWTLVLAGVDSLAPTVAYDRAGLGGSEWDGEIPTPRHVTERLSSLLRVVGAEPPYVLVGHSWGAVLARYFAGYRPEEVAGVVFVDPGPVVTQTRREMLASYDSLGVGRAGYDAYWSFFGDFFRSASPAVRAEFEVFHGLMERELAGRDLRSLPAVPVAMIVAGAPVPLPPDIPLPYDPAAHFQVDLRHRLAAFHQWVAGSPRGTLVLSNATHHDVPSQEPELIVWAVRRVLSAVRR